MRITIIGAGKVGRSLARALRATSHPTTLRAARQGPPVRPIAAPLVVLAVRDAAVSAWATELAAAGVVGKRTAVVHVAGALGPAALAPLRGVAAGVAQAHPAVSFPSPRANPVVRGASLLVAGDPVAVQRASRMGRAVGLIPRSGEAVDALGYHAACALVANGAAAIADASCRLLMASGVAAEVAPALVGPLLRSVGDNVTRVGLPDALSGPVRRGDAETVRGHLARLRRQTPDLVPLYLELARTQLTMARNLADAPRAMLDEVQAVLGGRR